MIGVYNHLLRKVSRLHFHSQKVIGSLGRLIDLQLWTIILCIFVPDVSKHECVFWSLAKKWPFSSDRPFSVSDSLVNKTMGFFGRPKEDSWDPTKSRSLPPNPPKMGHEWMANLKKMLQNAGNVNESRMFFSVVCESHGSSMIFVSSKVSAEISTQFDFRAPKGFCRIYLEDGPPLSWMKLRGLTIHGKWDDLKAWFNAISHPIQRDIQQFSLRSFRTWSTKMKHTLLKTSDWGVSWMSRAGPSTTLSGSKSRPVKMLGFHLVGSLKGCLLKVKISTENQSAILRKKATHPQKK